MSDWKEKEKKIEDIFSEYGIRDIAKSLLCMCLWLPNLSSQMKNAYLTLLFITRIPSVFQNENKISSYEDFKKLVNIVIELTPSFPMEEDFFPETDWGEIKFYFQNKIYKIFYGNEITDIYDYLSMFEIKYASIDKQFKEIVNRSPIEEFQTCLALQNKIITAISQNMHEDEKESLENGYYEIPEESFWNEIFSFDFNSNFKSLVTECVTTNYSVCLGENKFPESHSDFVDSIIYGLNSSYYFLHYGEQYYPINPRRYSCILIEKWFRLLQENKNQLFSRKKDKEFYASFSISEFINVRIANGNKYKIVSAVTDDGKPHEAIFSSAILYQDELLLFYLLDEDASIGQEVNLVNEAIKLFKQKPYTLALLLENQLLRIKPKNKEQSLEPHVIYLYPNLNINEFGSHIKIPETLKGTFFYLTSFLGIFDEIANIKEFLDFCDYIQRKSEPIIPLASVLDRYAAYKDSHKIIIEGALTPNIIALDPHWGSHYKYQRLKEFWNLYPDRNYFGHPRSWLPKSQGKHIILFARDDKGYAHFIKISDINIFITAPFDKMNFTEAQISELQLGCLADYITITADIIKSLQVLEVFKDIHITFIPDTLVVRENDFNELKNDLSNLDLRRGAVFIPKEEEVVLRVLFDCERTKKDFLEPSTNVQEVALLLFVIRLFDQLIIKSNINSIAEKIHSRLRNKKARHALMAIDMDVCFNENPPSAILPDSHAFKLARKKVAEIVKKLNITPGNYALEDAKQKINQIRDKFVEEIDAYILKYDFLTSITILIKNIECLIHHADTELCMIEKSVSHEVEFDRAEKYNRVHTEYLSAHKSYRYIIEKFVQHSSIGGDTLNIQDTQYLLAFSNEVQHLYQTSNLIHYGLYPIGLSISDSYLFNVLEKDIENKNELYGKILSENQIYRGKPEDTIIDKDKEIASYQNEMDEVFFREMGFKIKNFAKVCGILANCPRYDSEIEKSCYYILEKDKIVLSCESILTECKKTEIESILDILTLKQDKMLTIIDDENESKDLPVWEHNKRPYRYTVKPIIRLNGNILLWGPYSVHKVYTNWTKQLMKGTTPYNLQNKSIESIIEKRKSDIGKKLENKSYEIIKRHTLFIEKNVRFHRRDKEGNHPESLGDYDVLAYLQEKNIVLNIECKDLLPAYCEKDSQSLRDKIYGDEKDKKYIGKVINRENYLIQNLDKIFSILRWECDDISQIKIFSIFTVRQLFGWYVSHPYPIDIKFVQLSKLDEFIKEIKK